MTSVGTSIVGRSATRSQCRELGVGAHAELARPLHGHVDLRVDVREAALHRLRPVVGGHPQRVVLVVVRGSSSSMYRGFSMSPAASSALISASTAWSIVGHQHLLGVGGVGRGARHHVGDDQAAQVLLVRQGVLHGQDAAPRLAVEHEVLAVQAQRLADLLHLVDEAVKLPQRRLVGLVAEPGAELVVVVVLDPGARAGSCRTPPGTRAWPRGRRAAAAPSGPGCCRSAWSTRERAASAC